MRYKIRPLPICLIGWCLLCNLLLTNKLDQYFYLNTTKSLPRGLYLVIKKLPQVGDLVVIDLPVEIRNFLLNKEQLEFRGLLLKPIIAMNGDYVCTGNNSVVINNQITLAANKRLTLYQICRQLTTEELFVAVSTKDNSLDSRYFGPILKQHLKALVRPLITFK